MHTAQPPEAVAPTVQPPGVHTAQLASTGASVYKGQVLPDSLPIPPSSMPGPKQQPLPVPESLRTLLLSDVWSLCS